MPSISGIYKITNLVNGNFYIGSSVNLKRRFSFHKSVLKQGAHTNCHLQRAWNKYGESSFVFSIIELCDRASTLEREQYYINELKPAYNIAKSTSAPTLGLKMSDETREKVSRAVKGRPCSQETRDKISASLMGRPRKPHTQEFKDRMSALFAGRTISEKQKKQISESRKGRCTMSEEAKARLAERSRGNKYCLGFKHSDEARKNMSEAHKGKKQTREQIEKKSASLKLAWKRRKENAMNDEQNFG